MTYFALGLVIVVLSAALVWVLKYRTGAVVYPSSAIEPPGPADYGPDIDRWAAEVGRLTARVEELAVALAHGIEHVERTENRIKATVARARKSFADEGFESPGLEAEAAQLRLSDGGGSEEGELPPVRESMEGTPSSIEGVTVEELQRARGM